MDGKGVALKLTSVRGVLLIVACGLSFYLWRELRIQREQLDQLRSRQSLGAAAEAATGTMASVGRRQEPGVPAPGESRTVEESYLVEKGTAASAQVSGDSGLLKDPEFRKARLATIRGYLHKQYPGLIDELKLKPEEAGQLFDVLAEQQLEMQISYPPGKPGESIDHETAQRLARGRAEMQRRQNDSINAMLGYSRFLKYEEYLQNQQSYVDVAMLGEAFQGTGLPPLSASVRSALRTVYAADHQHEIRARGDAIRAANQSEGANPNRVGEALWKLKIDQNNRLLLAAASANLDARSLGELKRILDQRLEMSRGVTGQTMQQIEQ